MKIDASKAASRPLGVAEALVKHSIDEAAVYAKVVVLTGERNILQTDNGRWCFLDSLALLARVVGTLIVALPDGMETLEAEASKFCARAWCRGSLRVVHGAGSFPLNEADAILSIGAQVTPELPWTAVNSNGWVARVSSGEKSLPRDTHQANPLGSMMAASLGVTEVFKRIFGIPPAVAPLFVSDRHIGSTL